MAQTIDPPKYAEPFDDKAFFQALGEFIWKELPYFYEEGSQSLILDDQSQRDAAPPPISKDNNGDLRIRADGPARDYSDREQRPLPRDAREAAAAKRGLLEKLRANDAGAISLVERLIANGSIVAAPGRGVAPKQPSEVKEENLPNTSEYSIRKDPAGSIWWYFHGQPFRVVKSLRIPYRVKDPQALNHDPNTGMVVKHILIGFEGIDPNG